jgi:nitroreductase
MIELLRKRRSIRKYTDRPVKPEKIDILKEAVLRSPSSRNIDPWEFIFVDNHKLLKKLSQAKPHGASFLEHAALGIIICADGKKSDTWIEDCSIASILIQMTAQSIGLGSCWIQIRNRSYDKNTSSEDYIKEVLNLPEHMKVESIVAIGYPNEEREPIPKEDLKYERLHSNGY